MTNRVLTIIAVVQTCMILFLCVTFVSLNSRLQSLDQTFRTQSAPITGSTAQDRPVNVSGDNAMILDMRAVLKQELDPVIQRLDALEASSAPALPKPTQKAVSPEDTARAVADISGAINALKGSNTITAGDIAVIEAKIVRLPPAQRMKAFGDLNRAINRGEIDVRY